MQYKSVVRAWILEQIEATSPDPAALGEQWKHNRKPFTDEEMRKLNTVLEREILRMRATLANEGIVLRARVAKRL